MAVGENIQKSRKIRKIKTDLNRKPLSKAAFSYNINYKYDRICDII